MIIETVLSWCANWQARRKAKHTSGWDMSGIDTLAMMLRNQQSTPKRRLPK